MSIVPLEKITVVGLIEDKQKILADLQELGCLHLIPLSTREAPDPVGATSHAREALRFLLECPERRRQATQAKGFDPLEVERRALDLQSRLVRLRDERDHVASRIDDLEIWGSFELPPEEEMDGWRLWFYVVAHADLERFDSVEHPWEVVHRDAHASFVVVVAKNEPEDMPAPRMHLGARPRAQLEARLDEVELEIDRVQAERRSLSRWCLLLARNLDVLEDRETLEAASGETADEAPLFGLQAWAPVAELPGLRAHASKEGILLEHRPPEPDDAPPTLLRNGSTLESGEDLVTFYMTPGYRTWDPSSIVFVSFVVFFAMIFSDAGYGALLGVLLLTFWRRLGESTTGRRMRTLSVWLVLGTIGYGVLVGGYFGIPLPPDGALARLKILDPFDASTMMALSVVIGVAHLALANVMDAWRMGRRSGALAPLGWALLMVAGLAVAVGVAADSDAIGAMGYGGMAGGALLVLLFSDAEATPLARLGAGLLALVSRSTNAFGDVLSYLRLFALGIATGSLAVAFNGMAGDLRESLPGIGLLFAALVLLVGHGVNLLLAVMSGLVHGLRLNVIEFLKWGVPEEGNAYRAFRRKEGSIWTP